MRYGWTLNLIACIALGSAGAALSFIAIVLGSMYAGAGHGTTFPAELFLAPRGFGAVVWPLCFAAIGVPRKWLPITLGGVLLVIVVHWFSAWYLYTHPGPYFSYFERIWSDPRIRMNLTVLLWVACLIEATGPAGLLGRLLIQKLWMRRSTN